MVYNLGVRKLTGDNPKVVLAELSTLNQAVFVVTSELYGKNTHALKELALFWSRWLQFVHDTTLQPSEKEQGMITTREEGSVRLTSLY